MSFRSVPVPRRRAPRLDTIQTLRAIAAAMIVFLHSQELVHVQALGRGLIMTPVFGELLGAGVDLFFVISGFIIVFASERFFATPGGAREFLKRRLSRIIPMYWFALTLRVAVLTAMSMMGRDKLPGFTAVLTSYLFIPYDALGFGPRYPFPILDLGWTLNYEMFFYVSFACVVWLPRTLAGLTLVTVLLTGVGLVWVWSPSVVPVLFWFQPIVVDFAYGVLLALAYRSGFQFTTPLRVVAAIAGVALWYYLPTSLFDTTFGPGLYSWPRALILGGGSALIVAAAVFGPTEVGIPILRRLSALGDSSYALYLLHPFVFLIFKMLITAVPLAAWALWPLVIAATLVAVVVAHCFHRAVELPIFERLQSIGSPRLVG